MSFPNLFERRKMSSIAAQLLLFFCVYLFAITNVSASIPGPSSISLSKVDCRSNSVNIDITGISNPHSIPFGLFVEYRSRVTGKSWGKWNHLASSVLSNEGIEGKDLKTNYQYQYRVKTIFFDPMFFPQPLQTVAESTWRNSNIIRKPYCKPSKLDDFFYTEQAATSFKVSWRWKGAADPKAKYYELYERESGKSWQKVYSGTKLDKVQTGKVKGKTYQHRVRACNPDACGDYTNVISVKTYPGVYLRGDFDGDGNKDTFYQALSKDSQSGVDKSSRYGGSSQLHRSWTGVHPSIPEIKDWSEDSYKAVVGNFGNSPGDEILLLGKSQIVLLHGDIVTPIVVRPEVQNAIISWNSSGQATYKAFDININADDYLVHLGNLDNDEYQEIILQAKRAGDTSYILDNDDRVIQTLKNGYYGADWSAVAYDLKVSDRNIIMTAKKSIYGNNVAYTRDSGSIRKLKYNISRPSITGPTEEYIVEGLPYRFTPSVTKNLGSLDFSVAGKPSWMTLNSATGVLTGSPPVSDVNNSYNVTLTLNPKPYQTSASTTFNIKVVEKFSIKQANYSVHQSSNGTIYLVSVNDVYKIVTSNGKQVIIKSSLAEYNAAGTSQITDYQVEFSDRNYDGHFDLALVPSNNSSRDLIVINHIDADVHDVIVGNEPIRNNLDYGPTELSPRIDNPLQGLDSGTVVGSLPAEFSVKPSGSAVYDVPITVAPGSGGVVPNISIAYDSLSSNGIIGMGWQITGSAAVTRCAKNIEQDNGQTGTLTLSNSDRVCLNGKRLYTTGSYWANNKTYRTEDNTSLKIKGKQGAGTYSNQIVSFTEHHTDGSRSIYGNPNNPIAVGGKVYVWPLYRRIDAAGNYIEYVYNQSEGNVAFRMSRVLYTGNEQTGQSPYNAIIFEYENRTDDIYQFSAGYPLTINKRLMRIRSKVNTNANGNGGNELRTYTLRYEYGAVTQNSLLKGITACRGDSCLPETTFDWQEGSNEFSHEFKLDLGTRYHNSRYGDPKGYLILDMDGDNTLDYYKIRDDKDSSLDDLIVVQGGNSFQELEVLTNYANKDFRYSVEVIDYDHDGKDDLIFRKNGNWHIVQAKQVSSTRYHDFYNTIDTGIPVQNDNIQIADHNGDNYPDISYVHNGKIWIRHNLKTGLPSRNKDKFGPATELVIPGLSLADNKAKEHFYNNLDSYVRVIDLDGDGQAEYLINRPKRSFEKQYYWGNPGDILSPTFRTLQGYYGELVLYRKDNDRLRLVKNFGNWHTKEYPILSNTVEERLIYNSRITDLNSDGLPDLAFVLDNAKTKKTHYAYLYNKGNFQFSEERVIGNEFNTVTKEFGRFTNLVIEEEKRFRQFVDFNSDGYKDMVFKSGNTLNVRYFNGQVLSAEENTGLSYHSTPINQLTDINGDTLPDYLFLHGRMHNHINLSQKRDLITQIIDGSSLVRDIVYSTSVHTKDSNAQSHNWGNGSMVTDVGAPIYLVSSTFKRNGNRNVENFSFRYEGLKAQVGRGLLGYRKFVVRDRINRKTVTTEYRQDFPFIGLMKSREVIDGDIGFGCARETTNVNYKISDFSLGYAWQATTKKYDDCFLESSPLSEKRVRNLNPDQFGKPETVETRVIDHVNAQTTTTSEILTYELYDLHYGGRLVRKQNNFDRVGASRIKQVTTFGYFSDTGLLEWKEVDPNGDNGSSSQDESNQHYGLKETYQRDNFGNVTTVTQTGSDGLSRRTRTRYDSRGRYPRYQDVYPNYPSLSGQMTTTTNYHSIFGTKTSTVSANGQASYLGYSTLGRLNFQSASDGTYSTIDKKLCSDSDDCPTRAYYKETTNVSHGPDTVVYYDKQGRKVEEKTELLTCYNTKGLADICAGEESKWIHKIYGYDHRGRKSVESRPHFEGGLVQISDLTFDRINNGFTAFLNDLPTGYSSFFYDARSRLVKQYRADRSIWETSYDKFSTSITNPAGNTTTNTKNALGQLIKVTDANNQTVEYKYDTLGSLRLVRRQHSDISGGSGNLDTVIRNDHLGRKLSINDPDKGRIEYRYNAFGEVIWQKDNKNQISITDYDPLGRKVEQFAYTNFDNNQFDQHIKYYYDTTANGKGLLAREEDLVNGITRTLTYNVMSLVAREEVAFSNGRRFFNDTVYDSLFRVKQVYDASDANSGVEYKYRNNQLVEKIDIRTGISLWQFLQADALGNVTAYQNGNGLVNYKIHDQNDGTLESIMTVKGRSTALQHDVFNFTNLGNLEFREDVVVNMRETFNYDSLNRLDNWTTSFRGNTKRFNVNYDHLGNIRRKTGIGDYQYGQSNCGVQAGPHAVTTAGSNSYCYDENGNMTSGGGRTNILYNTLDKPIDILTSKNHRIEYRYGLGGNRFKRIDTASDGKVKETLYIGNLEFIKENGKLTKTIRHIEGIAIETYTSQSGQRKLEFLHRDHLGSVELVTNINGNTVKKFSYDPWGSRRDETNYLQAGFGSIDSTLAFAIPDFKRGYTGHEHIDEAGLIHMNGRVYDPRLGRFLSADPYVQASGNLQSFNRYTYVMNNPLNATDPSGYFWQMVVVAALKAYKVYQYVSWLFAAYNYYQLANTLYSVVTAFKYGQGKGAIRQLAKGYVMSTIQTVIQEQFLEPTFKSWVAGPDKDGVGGFSSQMPENDSEAVRLYEDSVKKHGEVDGSIKLNEEQSLNYTTSGSEGFDRKVSSYFNKLKRNEYGLALLTKLAESDDSISIFETSGGSFAIQRGFWDFTWDRTIIGLNPNPIELPVFSQGAFGKRLYSTKVSPEYVLAHELYHAWQNVSYFGDTAIGSRVEHENTWEVDAVRYTNQIRVTSGLGRVRTQYSYGGPIIDSYSEAYKRTK